MLFDIHLQNSAIAAIIRQVVFVLEVASEASAITDRARLTGFPKLKQKCRG